jgi:hypothetical protein
VVKWIALVVMSLVVFPLGRAAAKDPRIARYLATAIGFLPFYLVSINVISYEAYRGDARGLELTLLDFLLVSLWIALPPSSSPTPMPWARYAYLAVAALSVVRADIPLYAGFGLFRLVRLYVLFHVLVRAFRDTRLGADVHRGLGAGVLYAAGLCLWQRYGLGYLQAPGPFSHQNTLAMAANMVTPSYFALVLGGKGGRFAIAVLGAGALAVLLTLSRGGMAMLVLACGVVFVGSLARKPTTRKAKMAGLALLALAAVLLKAYDTIVERFLHAPKTSEEARELFEEAAAHMLAQRPFGVGLNMFSHTLEAGGVGAEVGLPEGDRSGIVHNLYYLTAAELGWVGLVAFVWLVLTPVGWALRGAVRRPGVEGDFSLGIAASLVATLLQGKLEWALRITQLSQLFWILFAFAASLGLARRRARSSGARPSAVPSHRSRRGTGETKDTG